MRLVRHRQGCQNNANCAWCGCSLTTARGPHWEDLDIPDSTLITTTYYCNVCALLMQTDDGALLRTFVAVVVGT